MSKNNPIKLLPLKLRIKFYAFKYGLYAFIFAMIFALAFILNKHIEAFFLLLAYAFIRYKFPKTFHHPNTYWCVFWSILSMWLCVVATLPLRFSILSSVVVALVLCFILYKVQDYADMKAELNKPIIEIKPFDIATCTRDEFLAQCRKTRLGKDSTAIAVAYFYDKSMSLWDIAAKYDIDYDSAKQRMWRIKSKLEKH